MTSRARPPAGHTRRKRHPTVSARPTRPPLKQMTPGELCTWIVVSRAALERTMGRERASLDRRAARGMSTPTDDAHTADQRLEADLVETLHELARVVLRMAVGGPSA